MAVPKRRVSQTRRNKRRTHQKLSVPSLVECPHCHAMTLAHNACHKCGYYKGEKADHTVTEEEKRPGGR